jgi:TDG/mug DNA glycosylase family protein
MGLTTIDGELRGPLGLVTALCSNFWALHIANYLLLWPTIQSDTLHDMTPQTLLDQLRPGLRLVVCGTAAGRASTARYAERGNRFWHVLHEVRLTATELQRGDYATLLEARIGLTDLAEYSAGMDAVLHGNALYAARLRDVVEAIQPRALAFNGKKTASLFYRGGAHRLNYGRQSESIGATTCYVLPSTAATSAFWSIEPWRELARELR